MSKLIYLFFVCFALIATQVSDQPNASVNNKNIQSENAKLNTHPLLNNDGLAHRVQKNSTLFESLKKVGLSHQDIHDIVSAAKPYKNLNRLPAGISYNVYRELLPINEPMGIKIKFSEVDFLEISKTSSLTWEAKTIKEKIEKKYYTFSGIVLSSLWESAIDANLDPSLIIELTEVFAWQVDFAREVQKNDRWRLTVEKYFVKNKDVGWGKIVAAEYDRGGEIHTAIFFSQGKNVSGYFTPEGKSLRRMFLKTPMRFGRISSRFSWRRFHPILKRRIPHLGVDYAAKPGTPIRVVGDGKVTFVGWKGYGGKTVKVRHNSVYSTAYKHIQGYAKGIKNGARVSQGQIIGYVGSTGRATGPHLHFEFYENGRYVDPMGRKFPSANPVPQQYLSDFKQKAERYLSTLSPWFRPGITLQGPVLARIRSEDNNIKTQ